MQFRGIVNYREDTGGAKSDEFDSGLVPRRLELSGNAFKNPNTSSSSKQPRRRNGSLLDAYVKYMFSRDWTSGRQFESLTHEKLVALTATRGRPHRAGQHHGRQPL
jgi:hypothetical protein